MEKGEDFIIAETLSELVDGMNKLTGENRLDLAHIERQIISRDREMDNSFTKDLQITALRGARKYLGDKLIRVAAPHKILDPKKRTINRRKIKYCQSQDTWRAANRSIMQSP